MQSNRRSVSCTIWRRPFAVANRHNSHSGSLFHQGRAMKERTPYKAFTDGLPKKGNAKMKPKTKAA